MNTQQALRARVITDRYMVVDPLIALRSAASAVQESAARLRSEAAKLGADVHRWRRESDPNQPAVRVITLR